jgi:hypothetical protein
LALELAGEPQVCLAVLALRAMAVAAGGRDDVRAAAILAAIAHRAECLGAALANGLDNLTLLGRDPFGEALEILGGIAAEEVLKGAHLEVPHRAVLMRA